ncbi:hypothetical protein OC835_007915, partial [Tilletia horrida]
MQGDEGAVRAHLAECLLPCGGAALDSAVEGPGNEAAAAAAAAEPAPIVAPVAAPVAAPLVDPADPLAAAAAVASPSASPAGPVANPAARKIVAGGEVLVGPARRPAASLPRRAVVAASLLWLGVVHAAAAYLAHALITFVGVHVTEERA